MSRGIPLDDADREPWLEALRAALLQWSAERRNVVLACSALKKIYRDRLKISSEVKFVYLKGSYEVIYQRLLSRHGHFATEEILKSQFEALEEPEDAIVVEVGGTPEEIVSDIRDRLKLS